MLEFDTQGAHFGSPVDAEQFSPFAWRAIAQRLNRFEPRERHESQKQKDGFEAIKALGKLKIFVGVTQQTADQQRRQRQQDAAFRNIKCGCKLRGNLIKEPDACRQPFQSCGCSASHRGGAICFGALAFGAGRRSFHDRNSPATHRDHTIRFGVRAVDAPDYGGVFTLFFLTNLRTLPARIAFWSVLRFN